MKTKKSFVRRAVMLAILGAALVWISPVFAQQPTASDMMLQKYGKAARPQSMEGTLYCMRCNLSPTPENLATCDKEGHEHFLLMKDGHMHHLYGINQEIAAKINSKALHEKKVKIRGMYYPTSNAILVSQIEPVT